MEGAVDEQLGAPIGDPDLVQDFGEVVREESVSRPLGEESYSDDDAHAFAVSWGREERFPADVGGGGLVELESSLDFVELELYDRILSEYFNTSITKSASEHVLVAIGVVIGECPQSFGFASLAH